MRRKTEDRRLSFVEAAGALSVEQGFGAVTMEAIALRAGASKATLYNYFPSKEALFKTFVHEAGKGGLEELDAAKQFGSVKEILHRLGMAYLNLVTRSDVIAINRLIMGEAGRHPQLSRIFYENGPRKTLIVICETIELLMDRGELRCTNVRQAGLYFKALCEAGLVERQLWGLDLVPDAAIRRAAVEDATDVYLSAFAAPETCPLAK
ncbi:TetR/AcrR family transcriptional regulator [Acerihabitans sp. TG2]|uniref:TetR/AcrR family transcriptional regulator n=1 Tax=Acerihabitans sp. TG2 TaxID=3096008 RepID=UPI002B22676A|nr:TetR/AcrR family transcriptional regulator [Acerihabitans sp. TG2]MEA9391559.1 TetR/AcrR family transcriptional regulator [Acerihabitans sp. TG2]